MYTREDDNLSDSELNSIHSGMEENKEVEVNEHNEVIFANNVLKYQYMSILKRNLKSNNQYQL